MGKIPGGYYIKARQIKYSAIAHAPPHIREIWDYLIREANHSGKKKNGEILGRGQVFTSYDEIREDLHWMVGWRKHRYTKDQCESAMKFLRKPQRNGPMITTRKTTRGLIITVCNYGFFQDQKNYENHNDNHNENHNETGDSPQTADTIDKNEKNVKDTPPTPPGGDSVGSGYSVSFETWWAEYPSKVGKMAAFRAWKRIGKSKAASVTELTEAIKKQVQANHFRGTDGSDYIPNPATWLNQGRWSDEIKQIQSPTRPSRPLFNPEKRYGDE